MKNNVNTFIYELSKCIFDYTLSIFLIVLLSPITLLIAIIIKLSNEGPVFYLHQRVGKQGKLFNMYKFRTMVVNADEVLQERINKYPAFREEWEQYQSITNDPRITKIGKILRRTSIDELPQLINILKGDMSLVGARPITADQIKMWNGKFTHYISTRPGITGLYQINGRNNLTFSQRIEMDTKYIKEKSFQLDMTILMKTFKAVISGEGAT